MKTYEAIYEPNKNKGVYGISLVENPAMEGLFIALSKDEIIQFKQLDKEQQILTGLALEPNKPIYRNQNGEEFNIVFSEETIKELAFGFLKNGYQNNSTLEHEDKISGVTFTESWIIEDEKNDKANALGFSYPKGSWMVTMKVDDPAIWEHYVKTGKVKGFSIDAMLSLKEVNLKSEIKMSENKSIVESITAAIQEGFKLAFSNKPTETKIQLGSIKTKDKNAEIMFDGEMMALGGKVWVLAEDGTEVPLPVGEYPLESDMILVVTEEGVVGELKEPVAEGESAPAEMSQSGLSDEQTNAITQAIKSVLIKYSEENNKVVEALQKELTDTKAELSKVNDEVVKLSNQPAAKPKSSNVQQVDLSKMSPVEKFRFLKGQN